MHLEDMLEMNPYSLTKVEKRNLFNEQIYNLTVHHMKHCPEYEKIVKALPSNGHFQTLKDYPMLPVRLFKSHELRSVPKDQIIKTLTSSGTTSQVVSKIYLDKANSVNQTKTLSVIMRSFLGNKRRPMILVDSDSIIKNRASFSARGAGLLGLTFMGRNHFYLLDENMNIKLDELHDFLNKYGHEDILVFGFTFMVWKYFYQVLEEKNIKLHLNKATLIHSGGWKKLTEEAVDNDTFKKLIKEQLGINHIHNFYGMVEQTGSIFMECEEGFLHTPIFSDIIIRDSNTLEPIPNGHKGIVQVISLLPTSYPGHNLLTEDLGTVYGEDTCSCGRKGKYFKIHGRLKASELRGCSDTHAEQVSGN